MLIRERPNKGFALEGWTIPMALALATTACATHTNSETLAKGTGDGGVTTCDRAPPAAALARAGTSNGITILPNGRALTPAGIQAPLGGFPVDIRVHPSLPIAYVMNTGYALRAVQVVDLTTGKLLQSIARPETFYGMALSSDASHLYTAGGFADTVDVWAVGADGTLTASAQIAIPAAASATTRAYPAGIALSPDGSKLWVGEFLGQKIDEIDLATSTITASIPLNTRAYSLLYVPALNQLWASSFAGTQLTVIDLSTHSVLDTLMVGADPNGLVLSKDGSKVLASVSGGDSVVAIDVATRRVASIHAVGEPQIVDAQGAPLPASSPAGLSIDPASGDLYVVRAADNAVSVLDGVSLASRGDIPVGWYPTSVALQGTKLVVTNGKGYGTGPLMAYGFGQDSGKAQMNGSISIVDLAGANLAALTAQVLANVQRPSTLYPFHCPDFPVPTTSGAKSPIEHIVLIVRENKTYDTLLGDLSDKNADGDPSLALYGESITPNVHALARQFAHHDNFYDDSECSTQGHLWLTSSFVNDYMERTWLEDYRGHSGFSTDPDTSYGQPAFGTFFTHLLAHNIDFTDYGEVTGAITLGAHWDTNFPGVYFNLSVKDEDKAKYVAGQLVGKGLMKPFVYVLLPDDHTNGTAPNALTPEAMISDNDYATGLLVDQISHSKWWPSTAIFLVEDDPQIGADHLEYHRSICLVMSPWAKHGHVSHVHTSYASLFRTFELILGLPPMNRYDALGTPFFDVFTNTPDMTPYAALPRTVPDTNNPPAAAGAAYSALMDFRGPDRNPDLGAVLWWERKGAPPPGSRIAAEVTSGKPPSIRAAQEESGDAEDEAEFKAADAFLATHPEIPADLRPWRQTPTASKDEE
jgi:DNA-binding beta-propeller fold protein YncE